MLEQRLAKLEQRLAEFERRLGSAARPMPPPHLPDSRLHRCLLLELWPPPALLSAFPPCLRRVQRPPAAVL